MRILADPSKTIWLASYALGLASARPRGRERLVDDVLIAAGADASLLESAWRTVRTWEVPDHTLAARTLDVLEAAALEVMNARRRPDGDRRNATPATAL